VQTKTQANRLRRRAFLSTGMMAAVTGTLLTGEKASAAGPLNTGDADILRFLGALEILESDLWTQYAELGGTQPPPGHTDPEVPGLTGGNPFYTDALTILDGDQPQYIHDNTDDEITHAAFIRAYLVSRGANVSELDLLFGPHFRTLKGSTAEGSSGKLRLTNLTELTIDTSFWGRYRTDSQNPDLGAFAFAQAVPTLNIGRHPAIPRSDDDTKGSTIGNPTDHLKAIAFTAGFHFAFIEVGGTSVYPSLAQRVSDVEVLRVLLSLGGTEIMHFQTWQDKAGNATPLTDTDPITKAFVQFFDLAMNQPETLQANLIMPEPCPFLNREFPICSIIRPTQTTGAAQGALNGLIQSGLFIGQSDEFFALLMDLAVDADKAKRSM
jgi:hypothetical protein